MRKYVTFALLSLASAIVTGCGVAPLDVDKDTPVPQQPQRAASSYVAPTPMPRIVGKPAPLLASAVAIPDAKLPNPNGYDLLVKAAKSVNREGAGSPLTMEKLSPEEDLKRQRASTQKNAAPLALVRQALKMPIVVPPKRGLRAPSPPYSDLRWLSRIILQESAVRAADGNPNLAVDGALDVVEMGAVLQNNSNSIGMLVGLAIESLGRGDIMRRRGEMSPEEAAQAARRLQAIEAKRPSFAAIQQEVMRNNLSEMRDLLRGPEWKKFRDGSDTKSYARMLKGFGDITALRRTSDLQIESNFMAASQAIIARDRLPYSPKLPIVPDPADAMSALFVGAETSRGVTRSRVSYERNAAAHRLLMVDLALQASTPSIDKYPQSLSELAPKYLKPVPRDPFAPNSPLGYKRQGDTFLLYSVGPDGIDNGGEPIKGRGISRDSVGDILPTS